MDFVISDLNFDSKFLQQGLEILIQRQPRPLVVAQSKQEAQVDLIVVWIEPILCKCLIIRSEDCAER